MTNEEALKYFKDAYQQVASYQANSTPHPQIAVMGQAFSKAVEALEANAIMREALEKLSRLGNGDRLGNSEGNCIAQSALEQAKGDK